MRIDVISIFPAMIEVPFSMSMIGRAREKELIDLRTHDLRTYSGNKHNMVDDTPYGGGPGMVMKAEPFFNALQDIRVVGEKSHVILMAPQGKPFTQKKAQELAAFKHLVFLCGHYEGIDERVSNLLADEEISIGDFVLTSGELSAMVVIDAIVRLLPGVLGHADSATEESFTDGLLEYPQYTKPREFQKLSVPEVLLSGNHAKINQWRRAQSLLRTLRRRPDLFDQLSLTKEDWQLLDDIIKEEMNE